ncbi:MAG: hypothetical protein ACLU80_04830 [Dorea sp.]
MVQFCRAGIPLGILRITVTLLHSICRRLSYQVSECVPDAFALLFAPSITSFLVVADGMINRKHRSDELVARCR